MDFGLTDDQRDIKRTARELLGERSRPERVRELAEAGGSDEALWRELSQLGWPGIAVSAEHGGQGLGCMELTILCEELGRTVAAVPFLPTVMAATKPRESVRLVMRLASAKDTADRESREHSSTGVRASRGAGPLTKEGIKLPDPRHARAVDAGVDRLTLGGLLAVLDESHGGARPQRVEEGALFGERGGSLRSACAEGGGGAHEEGETETDHPRGAPRDSVTRSGADRDHVTDSPNG